jgi:hypothetical protein
MPHVLAAPALVKAPVAIVIFGLAGDAMHVGATTHWAPPLWGNVGHLATLPDGAIPRLFTFAQINALLFRRMRPCSALGTGESGWRWLPRNQKASTLRLVLLRADATVLVSTRSPRSVLHFRGRGDPSVLGALSLCIKHVGEHSFTTIRVGFLGHVSVPSTNETTLSRSDAP